MAKQEETEAEAAAHRGASVGLGVVVLSGASKGVRKRLGARLTVGKAPDNELVLHDATVSRHHCEIVRIESGGYVIRDLGSRNGLKIGGARVKEAEIASGAAITIGGVDVLVQPFVTTIEALPSDNTRFGDAIGVSLAMRRVFGTLEYIAPTDATVLLTGGSGTGKDVLARSIVKKSRRAKKPFVVVDCGAVTMSLIDTELFGHVKGAFTGAQGTREGAFERADGGTIFLDEVGELPLDVQPKFLRVLERGEIVAVGSNRPRKVDVRVIAATARDLTADVKAGRFREDLWFRLAVVPLRVPSLSERRDDIAPLAAHFCEGRSLSQEALDVLVARDWPGNVRELRNVLERARALAPPDTPIGLAHLGLEQAVSEHD
ncbi:MAG: sigma 54-interacting transcriptional regulator [Deltaproteobacteria bacterium]|nr:sigma 54-interacting transcriptional regulator [Deltaproteobacteria bacterium]